MNVLGWIKLGVESLFLGFLLTWFQFDLDTLLRLILLYGFIQILMGRYQGKSLLFYDEMKLLLLSFVAYLWITILFVPVESVCMEMILKLLIICILQTCFTIIWSRYAHILFRPLFKKRVMIVGIGHTANALLTTCRANRYSLMDVQCCIDCNGSEYLDIVQDEVIKDEPIFKVNEIEDKIKEYDIDTILVAIPEMRKKDVRRLLLRVQDDVKVVKYLPQVPNTINFDSKIDDFDGLLMISTASGQIRPFSKLCKRILDILAALCGIILLIPTTIFVYFKNRSEGDTDPIFFTQERIGKDGKTFKLYKFRTMIPNAEKVLEELMEKDPKIKEEYTINKKLQHDPRITKAGEFLRKTSLDEFPQFINVLKGDMSLIGPRPYLLREKEDMGKYYKAIISCKPGLTGMWQTHGRSNVTFDYRLELDDYYYRNWTFWLDITLFLKTIRQVLIGSGAV